MSTSYELRHLKCRSTSLSSVRCTNSIGINNTETSIRRNDLLLKQSQLTSNCMQHLFSSTTAAQKTSMVKYFGRHFGQHSNSQPGDRHREERRREEKVPGTKGEAHTRLLTSPHWFLTKGIFTISEPALSIERLINVGTINNSPGFQEHQILLRERPCACTNQVAHPEMNTTAECVLSASEVT